jgi:PAS domain-containing protein
VSALTGSQQNFAISDPTLPDNPIVFVSQGFLELTGYTMSECLGRNCRFLQGPGTDQKAVEVIRRGIADGVDTSVCLLNYRADGSVRCCWLIDFRPVLHDPLFDSYPYMFFNRPR